MLTQSTVSIKGPYAAKDISAFSQYGFIDSMDCTEQDLVIAQVAEGFAALQAVRKLWVRSPLTRAAMREIITIPKLEVLDILEIRHLGKLMNFSEAVNLREFRCNHYMSEQDLFEVAKLPHLVKLGAQSAAIGHASLEAILAMPCLQRLDLEGSAFDDEMAAIVAQSKQIDTLNIGS